MRNGQGGRIAALTARVYELEGAGRDRPSGRKEEVPETPTSLPGTRIEPPPAPVPGAAAIRAATAQRHGPAFADPGRDAKFLGINR